MTTANSPLYERLAHLFDHGHRQDVPDLLTDERFVEADDTADAAVLIAITERDEPGVILTQRLQAMRRHGGQVAFPGGKIDPGEDAVTAALREAHEELALDPAHVRLIGTTDRYQTGTGFDITPVLGVVPPDLDLSPNPDEVEAWFEAPLSLLLDRSNWTENAMIWRGNTRHYLEMHYQGFRIWGVTAAILANLSRRIGHQGLFDVR
ncbi:CoA pyrophosphatase [Erythrobacteraceae bacterium E2-1 Yellow Sea]|nr:CoA pyrophosphatase [Erythrobacteraceae bacterium E2-1 Yellow Sea]